MGLDLARWDMGLFKKKKKSPSGYQFQAYEGLRPPRIDADTPYLRPTQDLTQKIIGERAQGIGVGFDPARRSAQESLLRSQLEKIQEDQLHGAYGDISASGLSGNLAAREAISGRVRRDVGRSLSEGLTNITIEDLTRQNEERDTNTERLRALNEFNFGQENTRANFDFGVYGAEQGFKQSEAAGALAQRNQDNEFTSDLIQTGIGAASLFSGNPSGAIMMAQPMMNQMNQSGVGVSPSALQPYNYGINSANALKGRRRNLNY